MNRQRLTLPGARQRSRVIRVELRVQGAPLVRRELLGARVGGLADRLERGAGAVADAGRARRARARASARAPCGGARTPCWTSARSAGSGAGPRRVRPTSTESTFGTGWKTVRETGRSTRTSQASWASTRRDAVGRACPARAANRSPTSFCTIATQRRDAGQLGDRAQDHASRRRRRAGWRRPWSGAGSSAARSSLTASARCSVVLAMRVERVAQRGLERAVELDDVDVRDALGEVLGEHAEAAADLEHDVVRRRAPRRARSRRGCSSRSGSSGRGRASGGCRTPSSAAGSAGRGARSPAEQARAVGVHRRLELARSRSRGARRRSARCGRRRRAGCAPCAPPAGVRYGASVSTRMRSSGARSAANASSRAFG